VKKFYKRLTLFLASIGPGLFLVGYNIGTGSVTTMASAGAAHGMSLTWAVFVSCVCTFVLIVVFGRFTLVTGQKSLHAFRLHFGPAITIFVMLSLIVSELISSMGVMAVMVQSVQEWSRPLTSSGQGFSTILLAAFFAAAIIASLFNGRYSMTEKILAFFVAIMGLSFVLTMFMVIPDISSVLKGLVPSIPAEPNAGVLVAGMLGTTMGGVLYVVRSITIKEKKWDITYFKHERNDAFISSTLMFLLSIAVMACAAGTLFPRGLRVENAIDMIKLLEPLAGRFAISLFVTGILAAGLSSLFPHYMLVPLLLSDYQDRLLNFRTPANRSIMVAYAACGLFVPVFGGRPVLFLIVSQALTLVVTPVLLVLMLILQNKKEVMGTHRASTSLNIILSAIILFTMYMSAVGVRGMLS
jgi:manganese transport protein